MGSFSSIMNILKPTMFILFFAADSTSGSFELKDFNPCCTVVLDLFLKMQFWSSSPFPLRKEAFPKPPGYHPLGCRHLKFWSIVSDKWNDFSCSRFTWHICTSRRSLSGEWILRLYSSRATTEAAVLSTACSWVFKNFSEIGQCSSLNSETNKTFIFSLVQNLFWVLLKGWIRSFLLTQFANRNWWEITEPLSDNDKISSTICSRRLKA